MAIEVDSALAALSVLLGVAVFHLGAARPTINDALSMSIPAAALTDERKSRRSKIHQVLLFSSMPSLMMLSAVLYVMLPILVLHITNFSFTWWNFEFYSTLYQMLGAIVTFYWVTSLGLVIRLVRKYLRLF